MGALWSPMLLALHLFSFNLSDMLKTENHCETGREQERKRRCAPNDYSLGALFHKPSLWGERCLSSETLRRRLFFESRIFRKKWFPKKAKYPEALWRRLWACARNALSLRPSMPSAGA